MILRRPQGFYRAGNFPLFLQGCQEGQVFRLRAVWHPCPAIATTTGRELPCGRLRPPGIAWRLSVVFAPPLAILPFVQKFLRQPGPPARAVPSQADAASRASASGPGFCSRAWLSAAKGIVGAHCHGVAIPGNAGRLSDDRKGQAVAFAGQVVLAGEQQPAHLVLSCTHIKCQTARATPVNARLPKARSSAMLPALLRRWATTSTAGPYFSASFAIGANTPRTSLSRWASVRPPRKLPTGSTTINLQSGSFTSAASMASTSASVISALVLAVGVYPADG